jgi:glycosyltransferase involved in cell wall biosynthesis
MPNLDYVLASSARNEGACIGQTIDSIARQTRTPLQWVIVDDGSTDDTAEIVRERAKEYPWLTLLPRKQAKERSYQSQYAAVMEACAAITAESYAYIGKVDTDLIFDREDHYESLIAAMEEQPKLGITGGWIEEDLGRGYEARVGNHHNSAPGGIQLFRRDCFEAIGGYHPLPYGGSDWLAEVMTRRCGWEVYTFEDFPVKHLRPTGGFEGAIRSAWRWGKRDASFGTLFVFCALKCARRITLKPYGLSSLIWLSGYLAFRIKQEQVAIPIEDCKYLRKEQRGRIKQMLSFSAADQASDEQ